MLRFLRLPARIPLRLPESQASQKWLAAAVIAVLATCVAVAWRYTKVISAPMAKLDDVLYDSMYELRRVESRVDGPVVIVAIDQASLSKMESGEPYDRRVPYPWPRDVYADMVEYFDKAGARVVAFDMIFSEFDPRSQQFGSDQTFADVVGEVKVPVVFGSMIDENGTPGPFAVPVKEPIFGAVNSEGGVHRIYRPLVNGYPSLAYRAATLYAGHEPARRDDYHAHFYGPHRTASGGTTYRYVRAFDVLAATLGGADVVKLSPDVFKDKIVVVGGIAAGMGDMKTIPLRNRDPSVPEYVYPGVEWQATAVDNLLAGQRVDAIHPAVRVAVTLAAAFAAAIGSLLPRTVTLKSTSAAVVFVLLCCVAALLFSGQTIRWLPTAAPLTAVVLATVSAFAWSYFTEDRQRRLILNALSQSISPKLAEQIARDPSKLNLGGERREMTVMFTDVAGFTDLSEQLEPERLADLMNFYLEEMSGIVLNQDGTLDKYIGDAIMSFWNAPLDQPDHADLACRTALGMARREHEMQEQLGQLGASALLTRIGLNTGPMVFGNLGSSRKASFTVLGDSVNLGARLEGANKIYGSQILMAATTAELVRGRFVMRELDLLRVKGKVRPMAVYELLAEGAPNEGLAERVEGYERGLAHYRARRWDEAAAALRGLLDAHPDDRPASKLLARVLMLRNNPPPEGWDGVYVAVDK